MSDGIAVLLFLLLAHSDPDGAGAEDVFQDDEEPSEVGIEDEEDIFDLDEEEEDWEDDEEPAEVLEVDEEWDEEDWDEDLEDDQGLSDDEDYGEEDLDIEAFGPDEED